MKSILMSIQPKWCELIASGKKTIEVRKTKPKIDTPFKVYIYCTKPSKKHQTICGSMVLNDDELYRHPTEGIKYGDSIELICCIDDCTKDNFLNGKVIGEFVCNDIAKVQNLMCSFIAEGQSNAETNRIACSSCLDFDDMKKYLGEKNGYAWHISDLKIYDKPKELSEFHKPCINPGSKICELCEFADFENGDVLFPRCINVLTRPPQSYCYVEEV